MKKPVNKVIVITLKVHGGRRQAQQVSGMVLAILRGHLGDRRWLVDGMKGTADVEWLVEEKL